MLSSLSLVLVAGAALTAPNDVMLLDFSATWCGPCRQMQPVVARLEREGYAVRQIDVDQQPGMARRYGIQGIPAFVLVRDGREIDRVVGTTTASHLKHLLDSAGGGPSQGISAAGGQLEGSATRASGRAASNDPPILRVKGSAGDQLSIRPAISTAPSENGAPDFMAPSVRVRVREKGASAYGSGTVIYSTPSEAVVLTCGHIFRETGRAGEILVDVYEGPMHTTVAGEVISFDLEADVGLVRIQTEGKLPALPVAPRSYQLRRGAGIASVGCSGGAAPSLERGRITAVNRYLGPANIECSGLPVQGRSGGGLFSEEGYVIGVCSAADPSEGRGLYAGLEVIQEELEKAGLGALLDDTGGALARNSQPRENRGSNSSTGADDEASGGVSESDVLAEIAGQFEESEVVCVIRSLKDPRAKSRVIVLDRASADFLTKLDEERRVQDSRHLTSLRKFDRPGEQPVLRVVDAPVEQSAAPTSRQSESASAGRVSSVRLAGELVPLNR